MTTVSDRDLRSLRALAEEEKLKRYLCVSLESRPRDVNGIAILPLSKCGSATRAQPSEPMAPLEPAEPRAPRQCEERFQSDLSRLTTMKSPSSQVAGFGPRRSVVRFSSG